MKTKLIKTKIYRLELLFFIFIFLFSCSGQQLNEKNQEYKDQRNFAFTEYMTSQKIPFKELNDSIFKAHYSDFLKYEKKLKLERNPFLKVNEVYVHYRTPTSVEFIVYSDEETFCLSSFDLDIDGKILGFPENGIIKVIEPIRVDDFGDFEIIGNELKTRKRQKYPGKVWYDYVNGTVKNDTIHFTEKYVGVNDYKFKKKWLAKTRKTDFKEIYQPTLKAEKRKNSIGLIYYIITGEFKVEN